MFTQKKEILNGNFDTNQFSIWLKQNFNFFHEFWKQSNVSEIIEAEKIQEKVVIDNKK